MQHMHAMLSSGRHGPTNLSPSAQLALSPSQQSADSFLYSTTENRLGPQAVKERSHMYMCTYMTYQMVTVYALLTLIVSWT